MIYFLTFKLWHHNTWFPCCSSSSSVTFLKPLFPTLFVTINAADAKRCSARSHTWRRRTSLILHEEKSDSEWILKPQGGDDGFQDKVTVGALWSQLQGRQTIVPKQEETSRSCESQNALWLSGVRGQDGAVTLPRHEEQPPWRRPPTLTRHTSAGYEQSEQPVEVRPWGTFWRKNRSHFINCWPSELLIGWSGDEEVFPVKWDEL